MRLVMVSVIATVAWCKCAAGGEPQNPNLFTLMNVLIQTSHVIKAIETAIICRQRSAEWQAKATDTLSDDMVKMGPLITLGAPIYPTEVRAFVAGVMLGQVAQTDIENQHFPGGRNALCDSIASTAGGWTAYLERADTLAK